MESNTLLRWAGSKKGQVSILKGLLPVNSKTIVEGFAGSAALSCSLNSSNSILVDNNRDLIDFYEYSSIGDKVYLKAEKYPRNELSYYEVRKQFNEACRGVDRSAMFLYLNRFCYGGIFRTNKKGEFNVPYSKVSPAFPSIERFKRFQALICNWDVKCSSVLDFDFSQHLGSVFYFDPPYLQSTDRFSGEYGQESYTYSDTALFLNIIEKLDQAGQKIIISYVQDSDLVLQLSHWNKIEVGVQSKLKNKAGKGKKRSEIILYNYD